MLIVSLSRNKKLRNIKRIGFSILLGQEKRQERGEGGILWAALPAQNRALVPADQKRKERIFVASGQFMQIIFDKHLHILMQRAGPQ